jgi:hypothetical protein
MSADNGIYILRTPKGFDFSGKQAYEYRVAELQAIDNLDWHVCSVHGTDYHFGNDGRPNCTECHTGMCHEEDCSIIQAREMFDHAHVFGIKEEALMQAGRISDDIARYGFPLEYGICDIEITREF